MTRAPLLFAAIATLCATPAIAQQAPASEPKTITEAARAVFGAEPPAADRQFAAQVVGADDIIPIVDECMKLSPLKPTFFPTLKADGWLLESGTDIPADHGWRGVFIRRGQRGHLIEHISQGDILHCEASGETGSAERRSRLWDALVSHYRATLASEYQGQNGFIENIREARPDLLRTIYVAADNNIFSHSDEDPKSTIISVDIF